MIGNNYAPSGQLIINSNFNLPLACFGYVPDFVPRLRVCVWVIRDTVVLGLGFPTLISDTGAGAMSVSDVKGVKQRDALAAC